MSVDIDGYSCTCWWSSELFRKLHWPGNDTVNNFFIFSLSLFFFSLDLFLPTLLQQLPRVSWLRLVRARAGMPPRGCVWISSRYWGPLGVWCTPATANTVHWCRRAFWMVLKSTEIVFRLWIWIWMLPCSGDQWRSNTKSLWWKMDSSKTHLEFCWFED